MTSAWYIPEADKVSRGWLREFANKGQGLKSRVVCGSHIFGPLAGDRARRQPAGLGHRARVRLRGAAPAGAGAAERHPRARHEDPQEAGDLRPR